MGVAYAHAPVCDCALHTGDYQEMEQELSGFVKYYMVQKNLYLSLLARCVNGTLNHYLSNYVFSIFCNTKHMSIRAGPWGQMLSALFTPHPSHWTQRGARSRRSGSPCQVNGWEEPFVPRNSPGSRLDARVVSLGRGTWWPFLARAMGGFHFGLCQSRPRPPALHSLTWFVTDNLLVDWDFLTDIMCPCFSNDADNIMYSSLLEWKGHLWAPLLLIVFYWLFCQWWGKKLIWKKCLAKCHENHLQL